MGKLQIRGGSGEVPQLEPREPYFDGEKLFIGNLEGNGNKEIGGSAGSGVSTYIEVTYDQLAGLIASSGLVPLQKYLIADYKTVHYFLDSYGNQHGINQGETEPLIVTAVSAQKLSSLAISAFYPADVIHYDPDPANFAKDLSFVDSDYNLIEGFKGVIYYRKDTVFNNSAGFDFRNFKFRRWKIASQADWTAGDYPKHQLVKGVDNAIYIALKATDQQLSVNHWAKLIPSSDYQYILPQTASSFAGLQVNSIIEIDQYRDFKVFSTVENSAKTYEDGVFQGVNILPIRDDENRWFIHPSIAINVVVISSGRRKFDVFNLSIGDVNGSTLIADEGMVNVDLPKFALGLSVGYKRNVRMHSVSDSIIGALSEMNQIGGEVIGSKIFGLSSVVLSGFISNVNICSGFSRLNIRSLRNSSVLSDTGVSMNALYETEILASNYDGKNYSMSVQSGSLVLTEIN
jgi:hypothetical protein